ncbi:selenocysteine synthase [Corynebacterium atypicum]|uniref:L-seryl-tRNA(Sec) selenium transferase n=1 Tax=Corynebacterium atypicum TaxID=191610 RepID=A0ABN4DGP7_9CORY|nr:selenocysteine synthase [Corynebacterium atypicum]
MPHTDLLLQLPEVVAASDQLTREALLSVITGAQQRARNLEISPEDVPAEVRAGLETKLNLGLSGVLNATGVVVHTNLGRAPLSEAAVAAFARAAGYVDIEMDLDTGRRSSNRGKATLQALLAACPAAEEALVVNNAASALLLSTAALAGGQEVVISRGELIEIGAGFRLPELIESTGVRLHEVGATNRTHAADYERACERGQARAILKVHPSNYVVEGFTSAVGVAELARIAHARGQYLIADVGSGLLRPYGPLPKEPDVDSALRAGADVVLASGDKLLGGPQAGIVLGTAEVLGRMKRHPLYRALRVDKMRLAALEATVTHRSVPVREFIERDRGWLEENTARLAAETGGTVVRHCGRVGGGGAPGVELEGLAVSLPAGVGEELRRSQPPVIAQVHAQECLVDLRCIPSGEVEALFSAVRQAVQRFHAAHDHA